MNTVLINGTPLNVGVKKTQPKKSKVLSKLKRQTTNIAAYFVFPAIVGMVIFTIVVANLFIGV